MVETNHGTLGRIHFAHIVYMTHNVVFGKVDETFEMLESLCFLKIDVIIGILVMRLARDNELQ